MSEPFIAAAQESDAESDARDESYIGNRKLIFRSNAKWNTNELVRVDNAYLI